MRTDRSRHLLPPALLAAALLTGPPPAAQDTGDEVVLGAGNHRYAWVAGWPRLGEGEELGNTHGCMVVDRAGRIYANTDTERAVVVFSPDGELVASWGEEFRGGLHGMTLVVETGADGEPVEHLYLAHTRRGEVVKTTLEGEVLWTLGLPKEAGIYEKPEQYKPTGVAVAPDGSLFVADGYGLSWVHRFDRDRAYLGSFGGRGTEPGRMQTPHGLWIDARGEEPVLVVCDRENHRLQLFDLEGELLRVVDHDLRRPCNVWPHGADLAVADLAGRVTVLGPDFELITHLGDNPDPELRARNGVGRDQWRPGEFLAPHSVCFDAAGNLFVMDWNRHGRLTKLRRLARD